MSIEKDVPEIDPAVISFDAEYREPPYGRYLPTRRVLGSMAASAAAGEFLRKSSRLVAPGDRPEPPHRRESEDEDIIGLPKAA